MDHIEIIDVRVQKAQTDADAASKDLQDTHSTIAVNYHLDPEKVNWIFQTLGAAFKDRIIDPAVQEVVKAITARYTAVELITQRERVRQEIREMLKTRMAGYHYMRKPCAEAAPESRSRPASVRSTKRYDERRHRSGLRRHDRNVRSAVVLV